MSSPACRLVDVSFCSQVAANQPLRPAGKTERWLEATNNAFLLVRRCAIRARHHENRLRPVREFDSRPVRLRRVRFSFPVELISFWLRVGCSSIRASICRGFGKPLDDLCLQEFFHVPSSWSVLARADERPPASRGFTRPLLFVRSKRPRRSNECGCFRFGSHSPSG